MKRVLFPALAGVVGVGTAAGVGRLQTARPTLEKVIARVEEMRGERREEFRDRYGDSGRDLVLYSGRRLCGLKLIELAEKASMDNYKAVTAAVARYEKRLKMDKAQQRLVKRVCQL